MKKEKPPLKTIFSLIIILLIISSLIFYINSFSQTLEDEQTNLIKTALTRSAVECYAIEGFFPKEASYLEENYNLHLNHDKYIFYYEYQGENMLPQIEVFIK